MKTRMETCITSARPALLLGVLLGCSSAFAANMDKAAYDKSETQINTEYKQDKAACDSLNGNRKDVCQEKAEAKEKVALAELTYNHTGKPADAEKLAKVRADTDYEVAKETCDDGTGNAKDVCMQQAKTNHVKALADIKVSEKSGKAMADAQDEKRDADYKLAAEKCDSLAGDAKDSCVKTAKSRFGKS